MTSRRLVLAFALALSTSALADECAVPSGASPSLAHISATDRLRFVRGELAHAGHRAHVWSATWMTLFAAGTAGQLALLPLYPASARIDLYVGAATSLLGFGAEVVLPVKTIADTRWLEKRIARADAKTDPCALLADAERLLTRDAQSEHDGQSPLLHGANFLVNIAAGLVIGIAANRWPSALVQIFGGSAIGEVTILSQPTDSIDALRRYREGDLAAHARSFMPKISLLPSLARDRATLDLAISF